MKTSNVEESVIRGIGATRGTRSTNIAGSKGMIWRDASTESTGQIRDMTVVGMEFIDNDDGTGTLTSTPEPSDLPTIEELLTDETDTTLVLSPDGLGGVHFRAESGGDGLVPYYIAVGDTYTVPMYRQALFAEAIEVDGGLVVNGLLLGVD